LKTGSKQKIKTFQTFVKTKVTNLKWQKWFNW
jgi:hypothetical protein